MAIATAPEAAGTQKADIFGDAVELPVISRPKPKFELMLTDSSDSDEDLPLAQRKLSLAGTLRVGSVQFSGGRMSLGTPTLVAWKVSCFLAESTCWETTTFSTHQPIQISIHCSCQTSASCQTRLPGLQAALPVQPANRHQTQEHRHRRLHQEEGTRERCQHSASEV